MLNTLKGVDLTVLSTKAFNNLCVSLTLCYFLLRERKMTLSGEYETFRTQAFVILYTLSSWNSIGHGHSINLHCQYRNYHKVKLVWLLPRDTDMFLSIVTLALMIAVRFYPPSGQWPLTQEPSVGHDARQSNLFTMCVYQFPSLSSPKLIYIHPRMVRLVHCQRRYVRVLHGASRTTGLTIAVYFNSLMAS